VRKRKTIDMHHSHKLKEVMKLLPIG